MKQRQMGLDIVRALAMLLVIALHLLGQGGLLQHAADNPGKYFLFSFLQILCYCAVDVYGITTGYLMCRKSFRLSRVTKLWLTTVFWSVAVSCAFFLLAPESRTFKEMVSMFLPILRGRYWFFTAYFIVMLVSPALNLLMGAMSRRQFHLLFAALFLIFGVVPVGALGNDVLRLSSGHHFSWMIVLYLIGGYLRLHGKDGNLASVPTGRWLAGYFLIAALHLGYKAAMTAVGLPGWRDLFLTYMSPLVLGEAICLFCCFEKSRLSVRPGSAGAKLLAFVSAGVYSVYVIHVHPLIYWNSEIINVFRSWDALSIPAALTAMLLTAVCVFAACVILDSLRRLLFRCLGIDRRAAVLSDRLEAGLRRMIGD